MTWWETLTALLAGHRRLDRRDRRRSDRSRHSRGCWRSRKKRSRPSPGACWWCCCRSSACCSSCCSATRASTGRCGESSGTGGRFGCATRPAGIRSTPRPNRRRIPDQTWEGMGRLARRFDAYPVTAGNKLHVLLRRPAGVRRHARRHSRGRAPCSPRILHLPVRPSRAGSSSTCWPRRRNRASRYGCSTTRWARAGWAGGGCGSSAGPAESMRHFFRSTRSAAASR